jgi:hypothetical protein
VAGGAIAVGLLVAGHDRRDHLAVGSLIAIFGVLILITRS